MIQSCDSAAAALHWEHLVRQVMRPAGLLQAARWRLIIRAIYIRRMLARSFGTRRAELRLEFSPLILRYLAWLSIRKAICLQVVPKASFDSVRRERRWASLQTTREAVGWHLTPREICL